MAKLTKADAARQLGISRTTLYKLIDQGTLSATPEGLIDTAELGHVLSTLDVHRERPRTPLDTRPLDAAFQGHEHRERPEDLSSAPQARTSSERPLTSTSGERERQWTSTYRDLVDILREQLQAAEERERDYREHIARLTAMLDQAHQQNQRLLDMPRPALPPAPSPARPSPGPPPLPSSGDPRGAMRRCIVALLQEHPEGLTPAEMRPLLGVDRSLADTLLGMLRYGLVQRVGRVGLGGIERPSRQGTIDDANIRHDYVRSRHDLVRNHQRQKR